MSRIIYVPTFCNHPHDVSDGKPINHECFILDAGLLGAERIGGEAMAVPVEPRRVHRGKRVKQ